MLETFPLLRGGLLPAGELARRRRAEVQASLAAPVAANLTAARARGVGITLELFASVDRGLTQRWARQLRRAGHRALVYAVRHDPTGRQRAVALFDSAGEHVPYDDPGWTWTWHELTGDAGLRTGLARYGIAVVADDLNLPVVSLADSGLPD